MYCAYLIMLTVQCVCYYMYVGNYSMLYTWNQNSASVELFSTSLGQFKSQSLVLEYNYMFVQVRSSSLKLTLIYSPPPSPHTQKLETTDVNNLLSALWVSYNRNTEFVQATFPIVKEHQVSSWNYR